MLQDRRFSSTRKRHRSPVILDELSQFFYLYQGKGFKDVLFPEFEGGEPQGVWRRINSFCAIKSNSKYQAISHLINFFNRVSEESPDLDKWIKNINKHGHDDFHHTFLWLLELYHKYKASLGDNPIRTDLSLLQQEAYLYLLDCDLSENVFEHVIIDEYQDTNMVQEYIVFKLAKGSKNICVVGDDDQALYRFRGATVENFVQFPERVKYYLGCDVKTIPLVINYRSQEDIVFHYGEFMNQIEWESNDGSNGYRVPKTIKAFNANDVRSVFRTCYDSIEACVETVADTVESFIDCGIVENANQIAFLFSSLRSRAVAVFKEALEKRGMRTYAPRAGSFLYTPEAMSMFGIISMIIGEYKPRFKSHEIETFKQWHRESITIAERIINSFFGSYLYTLFRREEREFENEQDPFPKYRIPFLTIHQSKGLEFPVVVMGTFYKRNRVPEIDKNFDFLLKGKEPLDLQPTFDAMRRLYVGMSRVENCLIITNAKRYVSSDFKPFMEGIPEISELNMKTIKKAAVSKDELPKSYSFTGDFNFYSQCPMQYQIFKKFAFPPSRSQTVEFGALVHQTIEDLHEYIISKKKG
jgi:superfamily I DNA/RNA helicase